MLIYLLPMALALLASVLTANRRTKLMELTPAFYSLLVLFVGLRYASIDYFNYQVIFNYVDDFSRLSFPNYVPLSGEKPVESFYSVLILLVKSLGGNFEVFIFLIAAISIAIKFYAFKKMSNFFYLSLLLYVAMWMRADLGQIRNGLSSALALLSVYHLYQHRYWAYSTAAASGLLVHIAAALSFLIYFFKKFANPIMMSLVLFISFLLAAAGGFGMKVIIYFSEIMGMGEEFRLVRYMDSKFAEAYSIFGGTALIHLVVALPAIIFYKRLVDKNAYNSILIPVYVYGLSMMFFFIDYGIMFARIKDLFCTPALTIILPSMVLIFSKNSRPLIYLGVIGFAILMFATTVQNAEPYQTIIFN